LYFPAAGLYENKVLKQSNKYDVSSMSAEGGKLVFQKGCSASKEPAADAGNEGVVLILLTKELTGL
jgi:hypothetical protein